MITAAPEAADDTSTWKLVTAAQAGDADAYAQLYNHYKDVVFRYILFRVGDRPLAEDLTSETFLRGLRRISTVSYQGRDVGAWFVTIARNLILDHVKSGRYRLEIPVPYVNDAPHDVRSIERLAIDKELAAQLERCLARLRPDQRRCVELRFLQQMTVTETADAMGRNVGAVKALQHRAVRQLQKLFPQEAA